MRIVSWNVNGLRAIYRRGFLEILEVFDADIVCLQEIKLHEDQLPVELVDPLGYSTFLNCAMKKGYSGVLVYSKQKPKKVIKVFGEERFDSEGRYIQLDYGDFVLVNVYMPHGGRRKENLGYKLQAFDKLYSKLGRMKGKVVLVGDFNIAHCEIDLARPKQNVKNIMFTKEEREMLDRLFEMGYHDSLRCFSKTGGQYTWWPYAFDARERNLGWRIDYGFVSGKMKRYLRDAKVLQEVYGSDHCPVEMDILVK